MKRLFRKIFSKNEMKSARSGYRDGDDKRTIADYPFIKGIGETFPDDIQRQLRNCRTQIKKTPDGDIPYFWLAQCYKELNQDDEAERILREGLERCKRKSVLLTALGELCLDRSQIVAMTECFVNSANAQTHSVISHRPYLYITWIAKGCQEGEISRRAEKIAQAHGYDFKADFKNEIMQLVNPYREHIIPILEMIVWPDTD